MTSTLNADWRGNVLVLELARPERRNALSRQLLEELVSALEEESAAKATAVVLTGSAGAFSAGADFAELVGTAADADFDRQVSRLSGAVRRLPRPVVAAIEGPCLGAAFDLALSCDVRVAGRGAVLGVPAVRLGLLYHPAAIARMHDVLGGQAARRVLLLGDRLDTTAARRLGVVDDVVDKGLALAAAVELAGALPVESSDAVAATKALLNGLDDRSAAPEDWQATYLQLLESPGRQRLLGEARSRHGGSYREQEG